MILKDRPRSIWAFPLVALAICLALMGGNWAGLSGTLRGGLFDAYQRLHPRAYQDARATAGYAVRVLALDRKSIARFGPWPWPRAVLAKLIGELKDQGAELVVLDLPLDRADPVSPANLIAEIPPGPSFDQTRAALEQMASPDTLLAKSLGRIATVLGFEMNDEGGESSTVPANRISYRGGKYPFAEVKNFASMSPPVSVLTRASAGTGALGLLPGEDGILRRVPLVFRLKGRPILSLDAEAVRIAENKRALSFGSGASDNLFSRTAGVGTVEMFQRELPTAPDGSIWIAFARDAGERLVSASALDAHALKAGRLRNAIVYIGAPDALVRTPFGMRTTASVHAEAMENILLGQVLRRPGAANIAELACLAIGGLALVLILTRFGIWWGALFTLAATIGAGAVSWQVFTANRVLLDALGPGLGLWLVFGAGAVARLFEVGGQRARLHEAFADSLSPSAIERIARKPELLKLAGENRNVTYLVCGVRGFAALAASFRDDPVAFNNLLKRVHGPLLDVVLAHRGTIERISGENFSAFWNAPLDDPEHAIHACEAAGGMMEAIARINEVITHERRIDGAALAPVEVGIGISTGPAVTGGFRTHGRTTYSAAGDCAVTASRIQQLSGLYGPAVIVGEDTRRSAERGFAFLEVDYLTVTPDGQPTKLYAMLGNPVMRASPKFRALTTFHDHIFQSIHTQQWAKARELIEQCRRLSGASQKLYDLHLARIAWFENHPPGADWDGAFRPVLK
jgi:adenylate cyclase